MNPLAAAVSDPNMAGSFPRYALTAVVVVYGGIALLWAAGVGWARFEKWLQDRNRPVNVYTFPRRDATVTRIHGKDGAA